MAVREDLKATRRAWFFQLKKTHSENVDFLPWFSYNPNDIVYVRQRVEVFVSDSYNSTLKSYS